MLAAWMIFFLTGLISASWAARVPATQDRLQLSAAQLGLAVLGIEAGALAGLPAGAALLRRYGVRRCLQCSFGLYPALLVPITVAPSLAILAVVLAGWAAANSVVDVAMNAAGLQVEGVLGRPLLSRLHAGQSIGLLAGGLGSVAVAERLPLWLHFGVVAVVGCVGGITSASALPRAHSARRTGITLDRGVLLLGAVAFCVFLIDGTAINWAAVDLRVHHGAGPAMAAAAYTGFTAAVAVARSCGDRALARAGRVRTVRICAVGTFAGSALVVSAPSACFAAIGWVVVGAGLGIMAPTVLGAAGINGEDPATRIATVTTLGYLGSFTGPPLIGLLTGVVPLGSALGVMALAAVVAGVTAGSALGTPGLSRAEIG